ncbi:Hypothetical protein CpOVI2C_00485 [Corynebacterium pseudotuberculosis]|nr:hypothetical protein CPTA_01026 [Corynebacterium pseudotuberculosis]AIG08563.1 hypothetical protein CPTB_00507 [Corynebacterium pseudotuberculosis]AIG10455.1 hypothetical protein CPTC_00167 [Corynebacterium pseudotuberculosis]AQL50599.1 hypothetical protein CpPA04_0491 [Corynebacterium pseudotuberculosis]ARB42065.1 Hypothetical protein CpSigmaE_0493 [Corynebacterium pseudotuberculosis]
MTVELLIASAFYFKNNDALVHAHNLSGIFGGLRDLRMSAMP